MSLFIQHPLFTQVYSTDRIIGNLILQMRSLGKFGNAGNKYLGHFFFTFKDEFQGRNGDYKQVMT